MYGLPDHVTRYNHKNESRWMTSPRPYRHTDAGTVVSNLVVMCALAQKIVRTYGFDGAGVEG